jgi:hypothetical protein
VREFSLTETRCMGGEPVARETAKRDERDPAFIGFQQWFWFLADVGTAPNIVTRLPHIIRLGSKL